MREINQQILRKWVEINDESRGTYNTVSRFKFKTTILSLLS